MSIEQNPESRPRNNTRQNRVFSEPVPPKKLHFRDETISRRSEIVDSGIGGVLGAGGPGGAASVDILLSRLGKSVVNPEDHHLDQTDEDIICHLADNEQHIPDKLLVDDAERGRLLNVYRDGWDYNLTLGDLVKRPFVWDGQTEELWFPDMLNANQKRRVFIAMKIKRISDVNNVTETFRLRFHIYFNWIATRAELTSYKTAKKESDEDATAAMNWSPEWRPQIEFPNVVEVHAQNWEFYPGEGTFRMLKHADFAFDPKKDNKPSDYEWDPQSAYFIRGKLECDLTLAEQLELQAFPLDCQDLSLIIVDRTPRGCVFLPEMRAPKFGAVDPRYSVIDEWELSAAMMEFHHEGSARSRKRYSRITFRLKLQRRWQVYLWNIVCLFSGICALGLTAFSIDNSAIGERLNLLMTLVLTAVAFSYVVLEQLPRVPYVTLMDKYILTSFFFLLCLNFESAFIGMIQDQTDTVWFYIALAFYISYHLFFAWYCRYVRNLERAKLKMTTDEVDAEVNMDRPALEMNIMNRYHVGENGLTLCFTSNVKIPKGLDAQTSDLAKSLDKEITRHLRGVHSQAELGLTDSIHEDAIKLT